MPGIDVTFTYAVPVHVLDLGAGLKAYIDTLPVINQLRLCNRFGRGEQAFITKLPVEVLGLIEYHIKRPIRRKFRAGWKKELRCFEQKCSVTDHFTWERKLEIYQDWARQMSLYSDSPREKPTEKDVNAVVEEMMDEGDIDDEFAVHFGRRGKWETRMAQPRHKKGRGFFGEHEDLVSNHFGVNIWISNVRLYSTSGGHNDCLDPTETTVAYLTLPDTTQRSERWGLSDAEEENGMFHPESGYGVPILPSGTPSKASLRRFSRAMQILGLKIFVHALQRGQPLSAQEKSGCGKDQTKTAYAATSWPQLTLLMRSAGEG